MVLVLPSHNVNDDDNHSYNALGKILLLPQFQANELPAHHHEMPDPVSSLSNINIDTDDNNVVDEIDPRSYFMTAAAEKQFCRVLWDLFDVDFEGEPDFYHRRIPEDANSLMDDDRAFLLPSLLTSPAFAHVSQRLHELRALLGRDMTPFPDRSVFIWLTHIIQWLALLERAVQPPQSTIGATRAKELIDLGERLFGGDLPLDVQRQLTQHLIHVGVDTAAGHAAMGVSGREGGAHGASGLLVLRWTAVLLRALRGDYARYQMWKDQQKTTGTKIIDVIHQNPRHYRQPHVLHQIQACEHELWRLAHEEMDLVVRDVDHPPTIIKKSDDASKKSLSSSSSVRDQLEYFLASFSSQAIARDYFQSHFGTGDAEGPQRDDLLDALLVRVEGFGPSSLQYESLVDLDDTHIDYPKLELRDRTRTMLFHALRKRAVTLPLELKVEALASCRWRAYEIELALHDRYELPDHTKDYRSTARTILHAFHQPANDWPLRVLADAVGADDFVAMPTEDFANPTVRQHRQEAAAKASRQLCLVEPLYPTQSEKKAASGQPVIAAGATSTKESDDVEHRGRDQGATSQLQDHSRSSYNKDEAIFNQLSYTRRNSLTPSDLDIHSSDPPSKPVAATNSKRPARHAPMDQPTPKAPKSVLKAPKSVLKLSSLIPAEKPAKRLPIPTVPDKENPSLDQHVANPHITNLHHGESAVAHHHMQQKQPSIDQGDMIKSTDGGHLFHFSFKKDEMFGFSTFLEKCMDNDGIADQLLPQQNVMKGASPSNALQSFLLPKLTNSKYSHFLLRVKPPNCEQDHAMYKQFYMTYEKKDKVAMFEVPEGTGSKAFLITPKLHKYVNHILPLTKPNSTYLVGYMTKKEPTMVPAAPELLPPAIKTTAATTELARTTMKPHAAAYQDKAATTAIVPIATAPQATVHQNKTATTAMVPTTVALQPTVEYSYAFQTDDDDYFML
jgi:hypothetical protein